MSASDERGARHPLWRPFELADLDAFAQAVVGPRSPAPVVVVRPDPRWPAAYDALATRVRAALGDAVLALEHVGSTAVPGLAAKPVVDADLTVADSADEAAYVPALEAAGFVLRIREPDWEEHRLLRLDAGLLPAEVGAPAVNLHVFGPGAVEPQRHVLFRDHLRRHPDARERYARAKGAAAQVGHTEAMAYNNDKAAAVYDLYEEAFAADPAHPHTPRPR